jgi:hypothetical protein
VFQLLKKRDNVDPAVILANAMTASRNNIKMCRYGNNCKRADCKFRHEKDTYVHAAVSRPNMNFHTLVRRASLGLKLDA